MAHAIIGCGRVSANHVYAARANGVRVSSCFDLERTKSEELAKTQELPKVASDLTEIWNDPAIESVSICTDHASHAPLTIAALLAGKNVLVEKPMATQVDDALSMLNTAYASGQTLAVVSQHRYNPLIQAIRELIQNGFFGLNGVGMATLECHKSDAYYRDSSWRGNLAREGGSTIINQFIHTLDILIWTFGLPIRVNGTSRSMRFAELIETEDTFCGWIEFTGGFMVNITSTNCSTVHWDSRIAIIGSRGTIAFSTGHPVLVQTFESKEPNASNILEQLHAISKAAESRTPPTMSYYGTSHVEQFKDFIESCKLKRSLIMPPTEALRTLIVVRALYKSAELQRPVDVQEVSTNDNFIEEIEPNAI